MGSGASGAGTNLKVGDTGAKPEKMYLVVPHPLFGFKSTISRCGERFRDGQYNLVTVLFAVPVFTVPPCQAICKTGGMTNGVGATVWGDAQTEIDFRACRV